MKNNRVRVLMVEDSPTDAKLILQTLKDHGFEVESERVETRITMQAALTRQWDLIICDWSLPSFNALAALALVKEIGVDLPFIIASGTIGEELAVEGMRAGAHDYVLKDKLPRLLPAVERELSDARAREAHRVAQKALRTQEARFRALIENSADAITLTDRDRKLLYLSPSIKRLLGYEPEELMGKLDLVLAQEDNSNIIESAMTSVRQTGAPPVTVQFRALHRDGSVRWLAGRFTNMLEDPAVGAIVGNLRDVTDRQHAIDNLDISEKRFKRLWDSGVIGIVVTDLAGHDRLEANDAALTMSGYTLDELRNGTVRWESLTPPEWKEADALVGRQLMETGVAPPWEKELIHKDGYRVPVLLGCAMVDATKCITVLADMSARKHAERALSDTENQLRQSQKMEAVGRLAGGVAHDFNNLLSVILTYSQFILDDLKPNDPMRADIDEVQKAGLRAADLTKQLLMFSRQQVIAPKVLNINELLRDMDKMLRRILGEDLELIFIPDPNLLHVKADRSGIEQVIMNLVVNARDAMPTSGSLTIETANALMDETYAAAHPGCKAGPHVLLTVTDTGTGMDAATQVRVFEPFFTTKETGKGTGLGLSTVFGIIQQSGGSIEVESALGQGTTFMIYLPSTDGEIEASRPAEKLDLRGHETILLVEDEEQVRTVARSILRKHGYKVLEARNGGEALLCCEKHEGPIHLLLTDVVMPQLSGPELAKRLATIKPEMKLLCMSGYTDDRIVRHGVQQSEIAFVPKPFTPESLAQKVREVLGKPEIVSRFG